MKIRLINRDFEQEKVDLIAVPVFADDKKFPERINFLAHQMTPDPEKVLGRPDFECKLNQYRIVYTTSEEFPVVAFVGAGKINEWNLEKSRQLWGTVLKISHELKILNPGIYWDDDLPISGTISSFLPEMVAALKTAEYRVREFISQKEDMPPQVQEVTIFFPNADESKKKFIEIGEKLGDSVNIARRLAESPANQLTPEKFVEEVTVFGEQYQWELEILDRAKMEELGMNSLLAVSLGSEHPPYLAIASYRHKKAKRTVGIVGKGVTFDTGGISIKPSKKMEDMKYDMSGAAAVLGALNAISATQLPVNVVAAMPLVENMPSGKAIRPGDVVKSYSGKTIEVINTDAEGRLILADTLSYVEKKYKPEFIVDLATLTGSVVVALGHMGAAVLSTNTDLLENLQEASNISGEKIWELPLWEEYQEIMKSKIADIRNISSSPQAGVITAAMFLKYFIEKTAWAHLDIAGTAWEMPEKSYRPAGSTGFGVRLLWQWANILASE